MFLRPKWSHHSLIIYDRLGRVKEDLMKFNVYLKQHRETYGYTQKQMAEIIGITLRSYQRYESGEREPNIETLVQIADFFKISLDDLIGRKFP